MKQIVIQNTADFKALVLALFSVELIATIYMMATRIDGFKRVSDFHGRKVHQWLLAMGISVIRGSKLLNEYQC